MQSRTAKSTSRRGLAVASWALCAAVSLSVGALGTTSPEVVGALWLGSAFGLIAISGGFFRVWSGLLTLAYCASFALWGFHLWTAAAFGELGQAPERLGVPWVGGGIFPTITAIPTAIVLRWGTGSWRPAWGVAAGILASCIPIPSSFSATLSGQFAEAPWCLCVTIAILSIMLFPPLSQPSIRCCSQCQYDLTGNASGICPECGVRIDPPRASLGALTPPASPATASTAPPAPAAVSPAIPHPPAPPR